MFRNTFLIFCAALTFFSAACQSVEKSNANAANSAAATTQTNQPPEFSGKMTTNQTATDPNAPKPMVLPKGATPTPGIPSEEELKKQMSAQPKKTPPIPGFPSQEEMKRQMNTPIANQRIRETKPPLYESNAEPQNPVDQRARKVRKP